MILCKLEEDNNIAVMPEPYNAMLEGMPYSNLNFLFESDIDLANANGWYELVETEPPESYLAAQYKLEDNKIIQYFV